MAAKKTSKTKSTDGGYVAPPGATNANRVSGAYNDAGMSLKQYFDSLYKQTPPKDNPSYRTAPPSNPKSISTTPNVRSGNIGRRVFPIPDRMEQTQKSTNPKTQPPPAPKTPIKITTKSQPINAKDASQLSKKLTKLEIAKFNKTYPKNPRPVNSGLGPRDMRPSYSPSRGDALSGRTPEGGTRSVLEGFKSFIRGGGLRGSGR